jgi:site-specific DNA-cytosine methylase
VVELCAGIMASTEALIRSGVKIAKLHACEIDPKARSVALTRLEVLSKIWPDRLPTTSV